MHTLLIDNDDSFTWNICQQVQSLGSECTVLHHTDVSRKTLEAQKPDRIILSPGPGRPEDAKGSLTLLQDSSLSVPLLGICLGHQCIAHVYGEKNAVSHAPTPMHGKTSEVHHTGESIFRGVPSPFLVARYHSLCVTKLPPEYILLGWTGSLQKKEVIMGMRHRSKPVYGVQFHPESFLTEYGDTIMKNFLFHVS